MTIKLQSVTQRRKFTSSLNGNGITHRLYLRRLLVCGGHFEEGTLDLQGILYHLCLLKKTILLYKM